MFFGSDSPIAEINSIFKLLRALVHGSFAQKIRHKTELPYFCQEPLIVNTNNEHSRQVSAHLPGCAWH